MQYPNPNTPWASHAEMISTLGERDRLGRKRYETDEAFQAACERKFALGYARSAEMVSSITPDSGVVSGDMQVEGERVRLTQEVDRLQALVELQDIERLAQYRPDDGGEPLPAVRPFESRAQMERWVGSSHYRNGNPRVREHVEARMVLTDLDGIVEQQSGA